MLFPPVHGPSIILGVFQKLWLFCLDDLGLWFVEKNRLRWIYETNQREWAAPSGSPCPISGIFLNKGWDLLVTEIERLKMEIVSLL
jgi:hypothetical protein